jgi:signal transduction histidine kinase
LRERRGEAIPYAMSDAQGSTASASGTPHPIQLQTDRMSESRTRPLRPPFSVRAHVFGLILVTLLPLLAFSAFLVIRSAEHEQEILASAVQDRTRAAARDIERELGNLRSQLFVVANAGEVQPGNFAALYARAIAVLGPRGMAVVLSQPDGKEVLDTRLPLDATLPDNPDTEAIRHVADSGVPYVSNLTVSPVTHAPDVMVNVPLMQQGKVAYVASLNVMPAIDAILARQQLPPSWIATISDRRGYTVARSREPDQFIGQPGRPDFLRRVRDVDEGWFPFLSREGIPLYIAFSRINPVGWSVVVGIPLDVLYAPVRHSTQILILVGVTTLAVALMLALLIGRRLACAITSLVKYAQMVGAGGPVGLRPTGVYETDAVASSLHRASENLRQSIAERSQAAADLLASEDRKHLLQQTVLVQEAERKRIARELHDSLGQYLTALQLGLSAIGRRFAADAGTTEALAKLRALTSEIGCEVNRMAWELRPTALDDLGLETAVTQYLEEWGERSRLHFDLQFNLGDQRLPQTVETTVYRALQEAVTNVVRHADAERVAVILETTGQQLQLIVEDDGRGFPSNETDSGEQRPLRLGLLGMRERLALVGGKLEIESSPGLGTTLFVRVPV